MFCAPTELEDDISAGGRKSSSAQNPQLDRRSCRSTPPPARPNAHNSKLGAGPYPRHKSYTFDKFLVSI